MFISTEYTSNLNYIFLSYLNTKAHLVEQVLERCQVQRVACTSGGSVIMEGRSEPGKRDGGWDQREGVNTAVSKEGRADVWEA